MLILCQILGISWGALRWYIGSAEGVRRDIWTFEFLKNFVVTSPSWERSVSHRLRMYSWQCVCWVCAHTLRIIFLLCNDFLLFWPCAHPDLVEQEQSKQLLDFKNMRVLREALKVGAGNHLCVSKLAFPELNLFILIWPPHPWSRFQTQLFPRCSVQA